MVRYTAWAKKWAKCLCASFSLKLSLLGIAAQLLGTH
jgi:hypothetical protein